MGCQPVEVRLPYRDDINGGLLCTTTGTLLGPLFKSLDEASEFCDWLREHHGLDPRQLTPLWLAKVVREFRRYAAVDVLQGGGAA